MENNKVILLNASLVQFRDDKTGEVRDLCKLTYAIACEESERFHGLSVLESYVKETAFEIAKQYVGKSVPTTIRTRATKNGVKYIIDSLNGQTFQ